MMDAPGVNGARDFLYMKNATSVTNYKAGFGLIDYLTTSSPTQQFVGSYRVMELYNKILAIVPR